MATMANTARPMARDDRFFLIMAIAMVGVMVAGFSLNLAMGRSSFAAPPLVHAHGVVFFGWVFIYLTQNMLVATGSIGLHRRLGWIAAGWVIAMLVLGFAITLWSVRNGKVVFFFQPQHFLVFNPLSLLVFAGLTAAAIVRRRETDWHRRLHFCGMAMLLGPGFGRLLPMPLLIPWSFHATFVATLIFPAIGVIADLRRTGRVHPAWWWGIGTMLVTAVAIQAVTYSALGDAIYQAAAAGSPGAAIAPLEFGSPPSGAPLIAERNTAI